MSDEKVANFNAARATKAGDSRLWTVKDCLEYMLNDLASGSCGATKIVISYLEPTKGEENSFTSGYYVAGATTAEAIAMLEAAKVAAIERWRR